MKRRALQWLCIGVFAATTLGCEGEDVPLQAPIPLEVDPQVFEDARLKVEGMALQTVNRENGWKCGYQDGWVGVLKDARDERPDRWRSQTVGGAFVWGLVMLGIGLLLTILLAWLLPRVRRKRKARADTQPETGWAAFLATGVDRVIAWLSKMLAVEQLDRQAADERAACVHACREAERQLAIALELVRGGAAGTGSEAETGTGSEAETEAGSGSEAETEAETEAKAVSAAAPAAKTGRRAVGAGANAFAEVLEAWRGELAAIRVRLAETSTYRARLNPTRLLETLRRHKRLAQQLRLELERAQAAGDRPSATRVASWRQLAANRVALPKAARAGALATWVRPAGWVGVGGFAIALPATAAWTAAGAMPFFLAFVLLLASLVTVLTARVHLFQAGRLPLLPGLSDRVASWLTRIAAVTLLLMVISGMATGESGLDLGDSPPVEWPDARLLEAPAAPSVLPGELDGFAPPKTPATTPAPPAEAPGFPGGAPPATPAP